MDVNNIIGQDFLKKYFDKIIAGKRSPHTQLFVGAKGSGTLQMALYFANKILCNDNENCSNRFNKLIHPDLHFIFPTVTTDSVKKPDSSAFINQWREFLLINSYADLFDWMQFLNVANKQGMIRASDAKNIINKVAVKPYEAPYKVFIIWMIEKMNMETANKLLKVLEEPPADTKFILIAEKIDNILPTIISRCQIHQFNPLNQFDIVNQLINQLNIDEKIAIKIAHQSNGNWNKALKLVNKSETDEKFKHLFISWVRIAFLAKKDRQAIQKLIKWSEELAGIGRETQKQFLQFALETFRQALLINYQNPQLTYFDFSDVKFDINKLAPFVHGNNIELIYQSINNSTYAIERNANPKLIFLELSIQLSKHIHLK